MKNFDQHQRKDKKILHSRNWNMCQTEIKMLVYLKQIFIVCVCVCVKKKRFKFYFFKETTSPQFLSLTETFDRCKICRRSELFEHFGLVLLVLLLTQNIISLVCCMEFCGYRSTWLNWNINKTKQNKGVSVNVSKLGYLHCWKETKYLGILHNYTTTESDYKKNICTNDTKQSQSINYYIIISVEFYWSHWEVS